MFRYIFLGNWLSPDIRMMRRYLPGWVLFAWLPALFILMLRIFCSWEVACGFLLGVLYFYALAFTCKALLIFHYIEIASIFSGCPMIRVTTKDKEVDTGE